MKIYSQIIVNGVKFNGSVRPEFADVIARRNMGTDYIGYINKVDLYSVGGTLIKTITGTRELNYEYDYEAKKYTVYAKFIDDSQDEYNVNQVTIYSTAPNGDKIISSFTGLIIQKTTDKTLIIEFYLYLIHDDKNNFHAESLAKELTGNINAETYKIVKVRVLDKEGNVIKDITNKTYETITTGYISGKYYSRYVVRFEDTSRDVYDIGSVIYFDEHGNQYIVHSGLDKHKTADLYAVFTLYIWNIIES